MAAKAPDRRVQRTHQLLRSALYSLVQEKGFESLSVQDIIDRANVGRATFYAHYENKEDLLVSGLESLRTSLQGIQRRALSQASRADERLFSFSREMFVHASQHRDLFRSMLGKRSGAVIQHLFHKMLVDLVRDDVKAVVPRNDTGSTSSEALVQFVAGGLFGIVLLWVDGKMRLAVDEVDALFRRLAISAVKAAMR